MEELGFWINQHIPLLKNVWMRSGSLGRLEPGLCKARPKRGPGLTAEQVIGVHNPFVKLERLQSAGHSRKKRGFFPLGCMRMPAEHLHPI